jgi:hypothetical protein
MFGSGLRLGAITVMTLLVLLLLGHRGTHRPIGVQPRAAEAAWSPIYFSPATNLEEVDLSLIERAVHSIDVAMYTFTDRRIAMALRREHPASNGRSKGRQYDDVGDGLGIDASEIPF